MNHYRGRIAPTPSGFLHTGHAATFLTAWKRCQQHKGTLILRNEDLDPLRCKEEFVQAMLEDLRWLGIAWDEGCDIGGAFAPYTQSLATDFYLNAWKQLKDNDFLYPCHRTRKDVREMTLAPNEDDDSLTEPIYPIEWRPEPGTGKDAPTPTGSNWRFRVPVGRMIQFHDERCGLQTFTAGRDFGDFLLWRKDNIPAYELAVVVDDIRMNISEVVRGEDLLLSTARQILLYEALGAKPPRFYHCPLIRDDSGKRLAKRHDALSLKTLRTAHPQLKPQDILPWCF